LRYATAGALRAALERRLVDEASATRADIARLRRRVVFERLLVRLAHDGDHWVLKGAAALEIRLVNRARTTRDIDVALIGIKADESAVRDSLVNAMVVDPDGDLFEFRIAGFRRMAIDELLDPVWRASIDCRLDGRTFDRVSIDIALAVEERHRVEVLRLPGALSFAGIAVADMPAIDRYQHFAEKLHALVRTYGDRPSTRVKDLADLVLLIDTGLPASGNLYEVVVDVFRSRGLSEAPDALPDPPADWPARYEELAAGLNLSAETLDGAMMLLRRFWSEARSSAMED